MILLQVNQRCLNMKLFPPIFKSFVASQLKLQQFFCIYFYFIFNDFWYLIVFVDNHEYFDLYVRLLELPI